MLRVPGVLLVVGLACSAAAQTRYEVDGKGGLKWYEFTGPPALPCLYPTGPILFGAAVSQATPCFPLGVFGPPPPTVIGDITDDMIKDLVYVTDGISVAEYSAATGLQTNVMPGTIPGVLPLNGLGFDSKAGILWCTDGSVIFGVTPSAPGSCALPTLVAGPFANLGLAAATDVTWAPGMGVLFAIDELGGVTGYTPGGTLAVPTWLAAGLCTMGVPFVGIDADTATGCGGPPQAFNITNGKIVGRIGLFGAPVATTFYDTATCSPVPVIETSGLAWAARPIHYGTGTGPLIGAKGQSVLPSPGFGLSLSGAAPGANAFLLVGLTPACPALTLVGQPLYLFPISSIIGPFTVTGGGTVTLPAPLPSAGSSGAPPCGLSVYMQWFVKPTSGPWKSSDGLELTFALP
jgi:hypothetical protein